jgi:septal ring factor EnvC (AmiA/AmiB activator)
MKPLLQNLLLGLALALCGLVTFQWVREAELRRKLQGLSDTVNVKVQATQSLQADLKTGAAEIERLAALRNQLADTVQSNSARLAQVVLELEQATNETARLQRSLASYKEALQTANDNLQKQNADIKRQNQEMTKLIEDRNDAVRKFNKIAADYNALAVKWNKQQEDLARRATNASAPP